MSSTRISVTGMSIGTMSVTGMSSTRMSVTGMSIVGRDAPRLFTRVVGALVVNELGRTRVFGALVVGELVVGELGCARVRGGAVRVQSGFGHVTRTRVAWAAPQGRRVEDEVGEHVRT